MPESGLFLERSLDPDFDADFGRSRDRKTLKDTEEWCSIETYESIWRVGVKFLVKIWRKLI